MAVYHSWALPRPASDSREHGGKRTAGEIFSEFFETFRSFFAKKQIWVAVAFMLLYPHEEVTVADGLLKPAGGHARKHHAESHESGAYGIMRISTYCRVSVWG